MKQPIILIRKADTVTVSIVMLVLAAVFTVLGGISLCDPFTTENTQMMIRVILPVASLLLYLVCILVLYRNGFQLSSIPFVGVMVSVMMGVFQLKTLPAFAEVLLCVVLAVVYCCYMSGALRYKAVVVALLVVTAIYHAAFDIVLQIMDKTEFYSFSQLLRELGTVLAFLGFAFAAGSTTRYVPVDLSKASEVAPPMPGTDVLTGKTNAAVSAPAPEEAEEAPARPEALAEEIPQEPFDVLLSGKDTGAEAVNGSAEQDTGAQPRPPKASFWQLFSKKTPETQSSGTLAEAPLARPEETASEETAADEPANDGTSAPEQTAGADDGTKQ